MNNHFKLDEKDLKKFLFENYKKYYYFIVYGGGKIKLYKSKINKEGERKCLK